MHEEPRTIRKSFGLKEEVRPALQASYHSALIDRIRAQGFRHETGRLSIFLAEEFGFCYGVDRAIDYAYETRVKFPGRKIYLINEIIHNPQVNAKLQEMGIRFLYGPYACGVSIADIQEDDIVIIPAFGASAGPLEELQKRGCILVDTTCGSVMSVWKRVEAYARDGFTAVIHGKYDHEETRATSSRALRHPQGKFLVVRDKAQAGRVCGYIEGRGNRSEFLEEFSRAMSGNFDPDRDLERIGCANQTTMLSSESIEIANMLQAAMVSRYGPEEARTRFRHFDTICSATQDRQDAVLKLARQGIDVMLVIGGYNSSNTGHLVEIAGEFCSSYHIQDAGCIISGTRIRHKKAFSPEIIETEGWLPDGKIKIGVTAGASTPNRVVEEVMERLGGVVSNGTAEGEKNTCDKS